MHPPVTVARKVSRCAILVAAVAALTAATAAQQEASPAASTPAPEHAVARKLKVKGVPNFGEVTPTLYRGAQPSPEGFKRLAEMGVSVVVDLRGTRDSEREEVTKLGMQYVSIPWRCLHPEDADFARFLTLLRENAGKKVFVHCRLGHDRSGMMVAAYRIAEQDWTAEEAKQEMEAFGFSFQHHSICSGLSFYEREFPERFKTSPAFKDLRATEPAPKPQL